MVLSKFRSKVGEHDMRIALVTYDNEPDIISDLEGCSTQGCMLGKIEALTDPVRQ